MLFSFKKKEDINKKKIKFVIKCIKNTFIIYNINVAETVLFVYICCSD